MSDELRKAAQDALDALKDRIVRIHTASLDGRPKQAYGEMVYAMTQMPEWDTLRAALQSCPDCGKPTPEGSIHTCSPQKPDSDAKQRLLEIMRRNGLATGHGDTLKQVIDTLEVELTDVLSAARQNAARYRWLRDVSDTEFMEELSDTFFGEWDAVIDAAMQQEQKP